MVEGSDVDDWERVGRRVLHPTWSVKASAGHATASKKLLVADAPPTMLLPTMLPLGGDKFTDDRP